MHLLCLDITGLHISEMKFLVLVACLSAVAYGQGPDAAAPIVRSESDVHSEGFQFAYETGNGIAAQASGALKKVDNFDALAVQGSYKYNAPDGSLVQVNYIADENGYQPQSDSLPVGPEIPAAILRALEYIAAHPAPVKAVRP